MHLQAMSTKYKAFKAAQSKKEHHTAMDEYAISAALTAADAPRYEGDAAQLCAIAQQARMDQPMLAWWIKVPASRARDWTAIALRAWTTKFSALLSAVTTGDHIRMCPHCNSHPARLIAGVWYCSSGNCAPSPAAAPQQHPPSGTA